MSAYGYYFIGLATGILVSILFVRMAISSWMDKNYKPELTQSMDESFSLGIDAAMKVVTDSVRVGCSFDLLMENLQKMKSVSIESPLNSPTLPATKATPLGE